MGYEIAKLVAQSATAAYSPVKDAFLYLKSKAKYVKELEVNLIELIVDMISVYCRKKQVDRLLEMSVSKEKNEEYRILCKQIEALRKDYDTFITKYGKHCGDDFPSEMPAELDVSTAENIIAVLQEKKPTIKTRKFFTLAELSQDIKKLHGYVSEVINKMKTENLIRETEPELVQLKDGDIDLWSANEYVNEILRYLRENTNRSIGIVGSIGVGKTNVMKRLNNQLEGNTSLKLNMVIWIDYPEELGTEENIIKKMQDVIMERLKLKEKTSSIEQNAELISKALGRRKYIVLVDQVSSIIDLGKVGIRTNHKFGKVVVASSNKKVIKQMTKQQVEIKKLPLGDAWTLFENVRGKVYDPRIRLVANNIIESCEGLSLVIKFVAAYLKDEEDECVWNYVQRILQSIDKTVRWPKLREMGRAYKLVYNGLEQNYWKTCLLFGALFPSNHKIYKDYLVECWMAEGFLPLFDPDVRQLRSGRQHGATVLRELTDTYLLEESSDNKYVTMPKFFRKVALEQQYPEEENCVIWVPQENKPPSEEVWKNATRMSLINCNPNLPECPESYNISTLLLQCNSELVSLGDSFFKNMENLRILDMSRANIESLPTSISRLANLISLYLNDCIGLAKLPPGVNMLTKIEILDIRGSSIPNLPQEIGDMIRLKCLRVSFAPKGCNRNSKGKEIEVMISPNIISRLEQLEELIVETGCCNPSLNNNANQIALELASLENLNTLSFHFPTAYSLKRFVSNSKSWRNTETFWETNTFKSFNISIGCCETQHPYGSEITGILAERQLRFSTNEEIRLSKNY